MASLTEPVRKSINRWPRMANVRKLDRLRKDHVAIPHHFLIPQPIGPN
jgi:hypothetical protein